MRISLHLGCRVGQQPLFEQMDECGLANTSWTNHEHHRAWPTGQDLFSGSTNRFENGIKRFYESRMFNEAMLLKVLLSHFWGLQEECSIKKWRLLNSQHLLMLCQHLRLLVHEGILLNTSSFSCFFGCSSCDAADGETWC